MHHVLVATARRGVWCQHTHRREDTGPRGARINPALSAPKPSAHAFPPSGVSCMLGLHTRRGTMLVWSSRHRHAQYREHSDCESSRLRIIIYRRRVLPPSLVRSRCLALNSSCDYRRKQQSLRHSLPCSHSQVPCAQARTHANEHAQFSHPHALYLYSLQTGTMYRTVSISSTSTTPANKEVPW